MRRNISLQPGAIPVAWAPHDEQVIHVSPIRFDGQHDRRLRERRPVRRGERPPARRPGREERQAGAKDCRLDLVEPRIDAASRWR